MDELKPCPLCLDGGRPSAYIVDYGYNDKYGNVWKAVTVCGKCGCNRERYVYDNRPNDAHWFDGVEPGCAPMAFLEDMKKHWNTRYEPTCEVEWKDDNWGICECKGDVYKHDIYCSSCGKKIKYE